MNDFKLGDIICFRNYWFSIYLKENKAISIHEKITTNCHGIALKNILIY